MQSLLPECFNLLSHLQVLIGAEMPIRFSRMPRIKTKTWIKTWNPNYELTCGSGSCTFPSLAESRRGFWEPDKDTRRVPTTFASCWFRTFPCTSPASNLIFFWNAIGVIQRNGNSNEMADPTKWHIQRNGISNEMAIQRKALNWAGMSWSELSWGDLSWTELSTANPSPAQPSSAHPRSAQLSSPLLSSAQFSFAHPSSA